MENIERVDWDSIQIVETHDEEGRIAVMSENQMCELLGLSEEEARNIPAQGFERRMDEQGHDDELGQNNDGAEIPTSDAIPGEHRPASASRRNHAPTSSSMLTVVGDEGRSCFCRSSARRS